MIELVKYLVTQIVDNPDDITINENVDETNTHIITLNVNPDDMGKVIGKGGKIIGAIRELLKVKAIKQGKRVRLTLEDPAQPQPTAEATPQAEADPVEEIPMEEVPVEKNVTEKSPVEENPPTEIDQSSQSEQQESQS